MKQQLILTVEDVLALIPVSRTSLYKAIANGELKSFRPTRRRMFTADAVKSFADFLSKYPAKRGAL